jgi:hypothetical protein
MSDARRLARAPGSRTTRAMKVVKVFGRVAASRVGWIGPFSPIFCPRSGHSPESLGKDHLVPMNGAWRIYDLLTKDVRSYRADLLGANKEAATQHHSSLRSASAPRNKRRSNAEVGAHAAARSPIVSGLNFCYRRYSAVDAHLDQRSVLPDLRASATAAVHAITDLRDWRRLLGKN